MDSYFIFCFYNIIIEAEYEIRIHSRQTQYSSSQNSMLLNEKLKKKLTKNIDISKALSLKLISQRA